MNNVLQGELDVRIASKENDKNLENVEKRPIEVLWGKSLNDLQHFTIKEIEKRRLICGKQNGTASRYQKH